MEVKTTDYSSGQKRAKMDYKSETELCLFYHTQQPEIMMEPVGPPPPVGDFEERSESENEGSMFIEADMAEEDRLLSLAENPNTLTAVHSWARGWERCGLPPVTSQMGRFAFINHLCRFIAKVKPATEGEYKPGSLKAATATLIKIWNDTHPARSADDKPLSIVSPDAKRVKDLLKGKIKDLIKHGLIDGDGARAVDPAEEAVVKLKLRFHLGQAPENLEDSMALPDLVGYVLWLIVSRAGLRFQVCRWLCDCSFTHLSF